MASKDLKGGITRQRITKVGGTGQGQLGVVGEVPNPIREELERNAEQLPVHDIEIFRLHDNPFQELARPQMDENGLEELASSIRQNGFYGALLARKRRSSPNEYELAYGHRRREAARRANLLTLPVKVVELSDLQMARIMASENFSREDLTPLGEADIIGYLYTTQNLSEVQLGEMVGKNRGWVHNRLILYNAAADIKQMVKDNPETFSHARELTRVKDEAWREELICLISEKKLTVEQLRDEVERGRQPKIDINFTNSITDANSDEIHNVSRENKRQPQDFDTPENYNRERASTLQRLQKLSGRLEKLAEECNYQMPQHEKEYLEEIIARLNQVYEKI